MHDPIEAALALLAGVFTIVSPCILPILPIVLDTAVEESQRARPVLMVAGFLLTFAAVGMLLGVASSTIDLAHGALRNVSIAMLALSGLMKFWPAPYRWLMARLEGPLKRLDACRKSAGPGHAGGFGLGVSLGAVWTPCTGPVLASILALVAKAQDVSWSATLLLLYAVGAAIPMLAVAFGGQFVRARLRHVVRHTVRLQQLFGLLVMLAAGAIFFQYDVIAYAWLADVSTTLRRI